MSEETCFWGRTNQCHYADPRDCNQIHPQTKVRLICTRSKEIEDLNDADYAAKAEHDEMMSKDDPDEEAKWRNQVREQEEGSYDEYYPEGDEEG